MTDKEKIELKDGVINIFNRFNTLDNTATIGGLRDDILRYIDSLQEELVSEDLEKAAEEWDESLYGSDAFKAGAKWQKTKDESTTEDLGEYINELSKQFPEVSFAKLSRIAVRVAKWQKQQDQSTIELAEDHAYFAGRTKTIDEMMEKAVETTFNVSLPSGLYDKLWVKGCKEGDKLLIIKKD